MCKNVKESSLHVIWNADPAFLLCRAFLQNLSYSGSHIITLLKLANYVTCYYKPGNKSQEQVSHFTCTGTGINITNKYWIWVVLLHIKFKPGVQAIACPWHNEENIVAVLQVIIMTKHLSVLLIPCSKWDTCPCNLFSSFSEQVTYSISKEYHILLQSQIMMHRLPLFNLIK